MKNILVPVGASENSISNLQYAIDLAKEVDANVYVVSVFPELSKVGALTKVNTILKEESQHRLAEVISKVDQKDVHVISYPIKGEIKEAIARFAKHIPVDLMVLSPRSNSIKEGVYLGNTSGKLLKTTNIPILVVPEGTVFKTPKIMLMAFKNGSFKKKTLEPVKQFVKNFDTEIHVLHVETPETTEEMKVASEGLSKLTSSYNHVESATTFQAILENLNKYEPDILCVVRRPRGFFKKLWEKNVILKKEFHTSKPLLVLPMQD